MNKLNIFTCCNGLHNEFITMFIFSHLYQNNEVFVEVGYDGELSDEVTVGLDYLDKLYPNKFLVRKCTVGEILYDNRVIKCSPNLTRFVEIPKTISEYIYISDIDIICLQKDLLKIHLDDISKTNLPYSNVVRKSSSEVKRLTGLHFTLFSNYYPIPDYNDLVKKGYQNHDEVFLYEIVKKRFPDFNYENQFRPVHGIHVSLNREPQGKPGWGIDTWKKQWSEFRSSTEFKKFENTLSDFIKTKIKLIDNIVDGQS